MFRLAEEFVHVLERGQEDDDGGACEADEEDNFEQAHAEENGGHGRRVPRSGTGRRIHAALRKEPRLRMVDSDSHDPPMRTIRTSQARLGLAVLSALLLNLCFPIAGPLPVWRTIFAWFGAGPLLLALLC